MNRGVHRSQKQRMKDKFLRKEKNHEYWTVTPSNIGKYVSCKKRCTCHICGNPRKYSKDKLTRAEKKVNISFKESFDE